ncbi:MAG: radical SAM protein [Elusimicrobiota bacterium]
MKILFFHPANYLEIGIPQGIAILSAVLTKEGHTVELFDTTFIKPASYLSEENKVMAGPAIYKKTPYTLEDLVKDDPVGDILKEFHNKIAAFNPDLLAVSTMTTNYDFALEIIKKLHCPCPVIFGGVHPTISPDEVLAEKCIDMVCVGEGELAIVELCKAMGKGGDIRPIKNIWTKDGKGGFYRNGQRPFVDMDTLPCPDWSLFDERHLFRPFMGKVYKGGFYISSRGCPCGCTYCVNRTLREMSSTCGKYFRYQKPEITIAHLTTFKKKYGATWFKFGDDTFLLQPNENLTKLRDGLRPLKIMFGCSVRPNTVNEEKVKLVKQMGCVAMSIGIESGNEKIRRNVLNRQISDIQIQNAFKIINEARIRISTFNLIGLPTESRENVFETIEFNRTLQVKSANVYVVYPFPGSHISQLYKTKYRKKNGKIIPMSDASVFKLSKMSPAEVDGLKKTFNHYLALPKELWPVVQLAEGKGAVSEIVFAALNNFASTIV